MTSKPCAVITGSTKGIGLAIAQELALRGFIPILNFRQDIPAAEKAIASLRDTCRDASLVQADVTTASGVQTLFEFALKLGPIDILVNNVGAFHYKPFLETSVDEWHAIFNSNLISAVLCCQSALPLMRERRQGCIINIASIHVDQIRSRPNTLPYSIAKAGLIHLTQALAKTEGVYGIRVNAVGPGFIEGGQYTRPEYAKKASLGKLGSAKDVAKAVGFLVSEEAKYVTGALLNVDGGALL